MKLSLGNLDEKLKRIGHSLTAYRTLAACLRKRFLAVAFEGQVYKLFEKH